MIIQDRKGIGSDPKKLS